MTSRTSRGTAAAVEVAGVAHRCPPPDTSHCDLLGIRDPATFCRETRKAFKVETAMPEFADWLRQANWRVLKTPDELWYAYQEYCIVCDRRALTPRRLQNAWFEIGTRPPRPDTGKGRKTMYVLNSQANMRVVAA